MYIFRSLRLEQVNTESGFSYKPGMDLCIHWLDPLFSECKSRLFP
jgi:hypothetical protein